MSQKVSETPLPRIFSVRPAADCCKVVAELDNGGPYRRHQPEIRGPVAYWIKNTLDAQLNEVVVPPPARVVMAKDGSIHGPGILTLPGDVIVAESLINCAQDNTVGALNRLDDGATYAAADDFSEGPKAPNVVHVLLKQMWDGNYGHWLIEGLPRVALLRDIIDVSNARFIVSPQRPAMQRVFVDSLANFGIAESQILVCNGKPIQVEQLIYPLPLTVQPWIKAPIVVRTLETLAAKVIPPVFHGNHNSRIFVDRPDSSRRQLHNKNAVLERARRRGFSIVSPAGMLFSAQVAAFVNARYVIGVLGAELANLAFSPLNCRLLGLAPSFMQDDFFFDLISHKEGQYFCLHGDPVDGTTTMNSIFEVDLSEFDKLLDMLLDV